MRGRDPDALSDAVLGGDRRALPRLLSIVEAGGSPARDVGRKVYGAGSGMFTVGITGPPGAGKSTLTDRLIREIRSADSEVAVLAVDPSSPYSGGALLGDRVRMMDHALDPGVFVRSMATRGHLGGLALAVPEVLRVLDAAGFPTTLIETVGVGQSEVEIAGAADSTMVVLTPGAGDSVQANKAGLLEVADLFVINKSDHPQTGELERDLGFMMELTSWPDGWIPPIVRTVASTGDGVRDVVAALEQHRIHLLATGLLDRRRAARAEAELRRVLAAVLEARARAVVGDARWEQLLAHVVERRLDPWSAADEIIRGVSGGETAL
ncbi:MAG: methylmalonyl Co-A mutase-associated GTPase MeaB [Acidimicrobiales bacterium]